jgi:hypothetical protein
MSLAGDAIGEKRVNAEPESNPAFSKPPYDFQAAAPVVQVKSIHCFSRIYIAVKIQCCYCFKEHEHADRGVTSCDFDCIPDELGHAAAECVNEAGSEYGYNISTVAWKMAGRSILASDPRVGPKPLKISAHGIAFGAVDSVPLASHLDKLVAVSKVFQDTRFIDILRENKKLKLDLYWKDHNFEKLKEAMIFANQKSNGPNCGCLTCAVSGRKNNGDRTQSLNNDCSFQSYFDALLLECGIVAKFYRGGAGVEHVSTQNSIFDESIKTFVYQEDAHLVRLAGNDWYVFSYGSKLWKESTAESSNLKRLSLLFRKLHELADEDSSDE